MHRTTAAAVGTDGFKAPEMVFGQGSFYASDVYSWAMTAYQMFVRKPPVASHSVQIKIEAIMDRVLQDVEVSGNKIACEALAHLLEYCMKMNYQERPSSNHLCNETNRIKQLLGGDCRSEDTAKELNIPNDNASDLLARQLAAAQETIKDTKEQLAEEKALRLEGEKKISGLQTLLDEAKLQCALNENRAKEAENQHEAERKLRIEVETRLKAEESKNVESQKKCKEVEDRALAEKTSFRQSLESLLKEEQAKLEKALEEANAQHRLLEEQLEMETSKFEALRSSVETLEKENKQLRDALVAEEEKNKADKTQTVMDTLGKLHLLINLLYYNKTHANKQRNAF
jgi:serine/threonine protein kinase